MTIPDLLAMMDNDDHVWSVVENYVSDKVLNNKALSLYDENFVNDVAALYKVP